MTPERTVHISKFLSLVLWHKAGEDGTGNAIDFARATIARTLIRRRQAAGLSQQALAQLAGVRQETISRIESGKHTATVRVIDRIDKALNRVESQAKAKTQDRRGGLQAVFKRAPRVELKVDRSRERPRSNTHFG